MHLDKQIFFQTTLIQGSQFALNFKCTLTHKKLNIHYSKNVLSMYYSSLYIWYFILYEIKFPQC